MYSTIKNMNIQIIHMLFNIGSKVRLKLGPACNTPTATSNLQTLYRGYIVLRHDCPVSIPRHSQPLSCNRESHSAKGVTNALAWGKKRARPDNKSLQESGYEWRGVRTLFVCKFTVIFFCYCRHYGRSKTPQKGWHSVDRGGVVGYGNLGEYKYPRTKNFRDLIYF